MLNIFIFVDIAISLFVKVKQKSAIRAEIALLLKQDEQSIAVEPCCKQSSENLGEPETAASDCLSNFPATLAQDDLRSPISELTSGAATDAMKRSSVEEYINNNPLFEKLGLTKTCFYLQTLCT